MKHFLRKRLLSFCFSMLVSCGVVQLTYAQVTATGPSSSQSPYILPRLTGYKITSILSAADTAANGYKMVGVPDGLGAFDNGDGTFTLLMNHELLNSQGVARAHGGNGSFVSKWVIKKSDLSVQSGADLIQNVNLWNGSGYTTYNAGNQPTPASLLVFQRFCSADLPAVSAFYSSASGKGTQERIYMNGEEVSEGRALAHIVTGANAGTSYELPRQGKMSFENQVANPHASDVTIVGMMDDASITTGNVYFYVGTKTNTGTEVEKAGLTNGKLYTVKVAGFAAERVSATTLNTLPLAGTHFDLVEIASPETLTGAQLNTASGTAGTTFFSRPEDGAWDPSKLTDFYFNTTDQIDQVNDGVGTQVGRSRLWRLRFTDLEHPELGGTIEAVLDGTEGQNMLDNLTIDKYGHITLLEDVGNSAHNGKVWQYDIKTDALKQIGKHDPARFGDIGVAATSPYNQDEETSGVLDVQDVLGAGWYLIDDQAHYLTGISTDVVEGGQLLAIYNPDTYKSDAAANNISPNTNQSPYLLPTQPGYKYVSFLSAGDTAANGYKMVGVPDGLGAFDNGDGTFTMLANHELIPPTQGVVRAHGGVGSFVSKWVIRKSDFSVLSGADLIKNVNLWNGSGYTTYNASNLPTPATLLNFGRFCSADLPAVSALYNSATGNGTQERIFMNGEEFTDGRAMAHIVTGANAGTSYELPKQGRMNFENQVANPKAQDKTILGLMDDATITTGNVYFYVGTKTNAGSEVDKAGLTNGKLYGVKVTGFAKERNSSSTINAVPAPGTHFDLVEITNPENLPTNNKLDSASLAVGATYFSRPEDGAWDPSKLTDFYFNTTDQIDQVNDGVGTQVGRSRLWRLRFTDISNPEAGGTVEAVLDGTEGQVMLDNMTIDKYGHITLLEDVGNSAHNGKVWQYDIKTDALKQIGKHDPARFGDIGAPATSPFNQDEESSGVLDVQDVLGAGWYLVDDQAHYLTGIPADVVEGGQFLAIYNPDTYNSYAAAAGVSPNSSQSPYLVPVKDGVTFKAIISAGDTAINGYKMVGVPDGLGAFDNNDGTFTLLANHELIPPAQGIVRAHGGVGSFVSKWVIRKSDLAVLSGADLIKNVKLWNGSGYSTYNASNLPTPSTLLNFGRFCSADLPAVTALYNSATGKGTQERIFMNGEEFTDGRAMAHIVTGANAGTSYELPKQGRMNFENQVANPKAQDKTILGLMDDATITTGNVYFYVGTKTNTGSEVDKAGLTNGKLYGVKVTGFAKERISSSTNNAVPAPGTHFDLVEIANPETLPTNNKLDSASLAVGATYFARPEDGAWDPSRLTDFYFNTTDQIDQVNDGIGTQVGRSRLWRLHFTDISNPEAGGTVEAVLDGTEGQNMLDNMTIDKFGHIILLEDVGNSAHNGKIWQYDIKTDSLKQIAKHDPARFGDVGAPATSPFNQDEETSGVIDVQSILGAGNYLLDDQAHYLTGIAPDVVEGGQILFMHNCNNSASFDTVKACGRSYMWNKQSYAASGTYTFVTKNASGCDSIATLVLTLVKDVAPVKPVISSPDVTNNVCPGGVVTLTTGTFSSYLWSTGETTQSITAANVTTNYTVTVTAPNGCERVSGKFRVSYMMCARPVSVAASGISSSSATLNWNPQPCAVGYTVQYRKKGDLGAFTTVNIPSGATSSYTVSGLTARTTYEWKVSATCIESPAVTSIYSTVRTFHTANATSFTFAATPEKSAAVTSGLHATVSPNPASSNVKVYVSGSASNVTITLTDLSGRTVWHAANVANGETSIPTATFANGTYIVTVQSAAERATLKLVIAK